MTKRTHLFVAPQASPFGEALLGMRIADELHARGDDIVLFAHPSLAVVAQGRPFRFVPSDAAPGRIGAPIAALASEVRATSIVLLDATAVYMALKTTGEDASFLRTVNRPVIGLDVWHLRQSGLEWDLCGSTWHHSRYSLDVTRRLIPVPIARPTGSKGLYNAFPPPTELEPGEREEMRADFGAREGERVIFLTSARWQEPERQAHEIGKRLATLLPRLVAQYLAALGPRVHVVHVGPARYPFDALLGDRYTWLPQRPPARFAKVLAAADLVLTFNFSATTVVSAIGAGIPVLLGINSFVGKSVEQLAEQLVEPPSELVRSWLNEALPLPAFRVWPLGLSRFLGALARDNPYTAAIETVEVFEERAFIGSLERLLFDERTRADLIARQATYREEVSRLPKAVDLVEGYLSR